MMHAARTNPRVCVAVGLTACLAPALHSITDIIEWAQGGYSAWLLWLNYAAFLPMPWLLLGLYAVHDPKPATAGLVGALLYGAAFVYFIHSTLYAVTERVADYEALWQRLGPLYTAHGGLMVAGGLLFGVAVLKAGQLPRPAVTLFLAGLTVNLVLALLPVPDLLQIAGSLLRNAGLMAMGYAVLRRSW